jgi:hypothetical protein
MPNAGRSSRSLDAQADPCVTVRQHVIASGLVVAEIRVWNSPLGSGKAGSGTRIARLKGIDNTYVSA